MKKYIAILTVLVLCSATTLAATCTDTDGGPDNPRNPDAHELETKGEAGYAISRKADTCLTFEGGVSTDEGIFLKEYYCDDDVMDSAVYDCTKLGYTGCRDGECYGGGTGTNSTTNNTGSTPATPDPSELCGNKIVDAGEDCDPPYSICFGKDMSEYGQCTADCKCDIANPEQPKCGNGQIDDGETCEEDSDCEHWEYCKKCLCVEKPADTATESTDNTTESTDTGTGSTDDSTESTTNTTKTVSTEPKEKTKQEIEKKYPTRNITPVEIGNVTNFTADPAIKTTSGIAKFFMGIWDWIKGIFS